MARYICQRMKVKLILTICVLVLCGTRVFAQDVQRLLQEGDSLLKVDRPQKAIDKYTAAIAIAPSANAYSARARAWFHMERMDHFLLDANKALKLDSLHIEANYQRALYAFRGEDYHTTERLTNRALNNGAKEPLKQQLTLLRGEARAELKKNVYAIQDLMDGLGGRTDDTQALKTLARLYDSVGDHAASLETLEKLCVVDPDDIGNWTNRGYELAALGRNDEALAMYGKALQMDKDEPTALSDRAATLLKMGREDEALNDVERSLRAYPANAFALRTRGIIRIHKGEMEKACADFSLAKILGEVPDIDKLISDNCADIKPKR